MLKPFRHRDFALLWTGMGVSFLGDGVYLIAVAFQAYSISNKPSALALVGAAWSAGLVGSLLTGGILADRLDRRLVMLGADAIRLGALGVMGALALSGTLEIWQMAALAFAYGCGEGLFTPAFEAIVPDIVPADELVAASAVRQFVQPLAMQLIGPAAGGALVAATEPGIALLADAGTFAVSLACVGALKVRTEHAAAREGAESSVRREFREGLAFVRATPWLWATMLSSAVAILVFAGPVEALLPYRIKNELGGSAGDLGLVLATAGVGALCGAAWRGQRGMPRRAVRTMYVCWAIGLLPIAGYGVASERWQLLLLAFGFGVLQSLGDVIWGTLMQTRVPPELRGRVSSLDWFVSLGLFPVSFALTAPVAATAGVNTTLVIAGVGGALTVALILLAVRELRAEDTSPDGAVLAVADA